MKNLSGGLFRIMVLLIALGAIFGYIGPQYFHFLKENKRLQDALKKAQNRIAKLESQLDIIQNTLPQCQADLESNQKELEEVNQKVESDQTKILHYQEVIRFMQSQISNSALETSHQYPLQKKTGLPNLKNENLLELALASPIGLLIWCVVFLWISYSQKKTNTVQMQKNKSNDTIWVKMTRKQVQQFSRWRHIHHC